MTIRYSVEELKGQGIYMGSYDAAVNATTERSYHPSWGNEKVYQYPCGIFLHNGNGDVCGMACEKAKGENGDDCVEHGG